MSIVFNSLTREGKLGFLVFFRFLDRSHNRSPGLKPIPPPVTMLKLGPKLGPKNPSSTSILYTLKNHVSLRSLYLPSLILLFLFLIDWRLTNRLVTDKLRHGQSR